MYIHGLSHIFGYKDSLVLVQCFSAGTTKKASDAAFDKQYPVFLNFGNSIVLPDRYIENEREIAKEVETYSYDKASRKFSGYTILSFLVIIFLIFVFPNVVKKCSKKLAKSKKKDNDK